MWQATVLLPLLARRRLEKTVPLLFEPTCLAVGNGQHIVPGRIYVGFADHVEVFDPDLSKVAIWQGIDKAHFSSISAGDHDVFIADAGLNVVQHFDTTGKLLSPIGERESGHFAPSPGGGTEHFGMVLGRDGLIYAVNRRECRIEGYNMSGEIRAALGAGLARAGGLCRPQQSGGDCAHGQRFRNCRRESIAGQGLQPLGRSDRCGLWSEGDGPRSRTWPPTGGTVY